MLTAVALLLASYLVGAVPFGYLIARAKGVNLFAVGSGNIGATNVGRVLGRKFGAAAFALDLLKGAGPVAAVVPLANQFDPAAADALGHPDALRVGAGALAFLGHLFPVYLGFRGGKGVATGAGVVAVLTPGPAAVAAVTWLAVTLASRYVSLGSVAAVTALVFARLVSTGGGFGHPAWIISTFVIVGSLLVAVKHLANVRRLLAGTENQTPDGDTRRTLLRGLHLVAVGLWCGAGFFFIFVAATPIFESFREVVEHQPSYRTGHARIVPPDATDDQRKALASGLAGAAVGPLFPRFFALSGLCGWVTLLTAVGFRRIDPAARVHRLRVLVCIAAFVLVVLGWPLSEYVARLNVERYDSPEANRRFLSLHGISLLGSGITTVLAGVALALGAKLPADPPRPNNP